MLRADLVAALQQLRLIHHRNLIAADIQVAAAEGVLEQEHEPVRKNRHKGHAPVQGKGLILRQFLVADNDILHPGILALNPVGTQDSRQDPGGPAVNHILVNHVIVDNRQAAVDSGP